MCALCNKACVGCLHAALGGCSYFPPFSDECKGTKVHPQIYNNVATSSHLPFPSECLQHISEIVSIHSSDGCIYYCSYIRRQGNEVQNWWSSTRMRIFLLGLKVLLEWRSSANTQCCKNLAAMDFLFFGLAKDGVITTLWNSSMNQK